MELRQLEYFVAVAETANFTRAAERCHVAQPSLSQSIINLEKELRQQLFDRLGRKVQLTEAGRMLFDRAKLILSTTEDTRRELRDFAEPASLSVGAIPTIAPFLLPNAVKKFLELHPTTPLMLHENFTERLVESIGEGELDVGIMALPIEDERLNSKVLFREELLLAIPKGHELTRKKHIGLKELLNVPFILLDEMHCLGEQVMTFCRRHAYGPKVVCRGAQLSTLLSLVAIGQGVSLIPHMAITEAASETTVFRSISGEAPTRTIAAVWNRRRYRSPLIDVFLNGIQTE